MLGSAKLRVGEIMLGSARIRVLEKLCLVQLGWELGRNYAGFSLDNSLGEFMLGSARMEFGRNYPKLQAGLSQERALDKKMSHFSNSDQAR